MAYNIGPGPKVDKKGTKKQKEIGTLCRATHAGTIVCSLWLVACNGNQASADDEFSPQQKSGRKWETFKWAYEENNKNE